MGTPVRGLAHRSATQASLSERRDVVGIEQPPGILPRSGVREVHVVVVHTRFDPRQATAAPTADDVGRVRLGVDTPLAAATAEVTVAAMPSVPARRQPVGHPSRNRSAAGVALAVHAAACAAATGLDLP